MTFDLAPAATRGPVAALRRGVRAPGGTAERAAVRPAAGRTQPGPARADRDVPRPGRQPRAGAAGVPAGRVRRLAPTIRRRCCAASISPRARRRARRSTGSPARWRAPSASTSAGRQSLRPVQGRSYFLEPPAEGGDLRRGPAGRAQSRRGATPAACCGAAGYAVAALLVVATAALLWQAAQRRPARDRRVGGGARRLRTDGAQPAAGSGRRRRPGAAGAAAGSGARAAAWRRRRSRHGCRPGCRSATSSMPRRACVYRHALEWALLPRLMWRLETQLRGNLEQRPTSSTRRRASI